MSAKPGARSAARAAGAEFYLPEKPCHNGHGCVRRASDGSCVECRKGYRHQTKDRRAALQKDWRSRNKQHLADYQSDYFAANRDRWRAYDQNRRCRERGDGLSKDLVARLLRLQRGKCACCAKPLGADFHLDHILPLALGGKNTDSNTQLLTKLCNLQKHAKHPTQFMRERGFLL